MKNITRKIRASQSLGLFHDSRQDVRAMGELLNEVINKVNELVFEINKIQKGRED